MDIINWKAFLLPYQQAVDEMCLKFQNIKRDYISSSRHSPIESVYGRVKNINSILSKANRKNVPYHQIEEKIEDIAGIRIVCRFVEDIPKIMDIIRSRRDYDMTLLEERDYISNRKPSGYRSYHALIRYVLFTSGGQRDIGCEIQLRTMAMDFWATIEHSLNYKYNGHIPAEVKDRLISSAEAAFRLDKEMSTIRDEIMEAQKVVQVKNDLVADILQNIQALYFEVKLEKANELNAQFMELYEEGSLEKLAEFNRMLKVILNLYKM